MTEEDTFRALKSCSLSEMQAILEAEFSAWEKVNQPNGSQFWNLPEQVRKNWRETADILFRRYGWTLKRYNAEKYKEHD